MHYVSTTGIDIYVGKNNLQNDYLTLRFASSDDLWLHTKDIHGSHVIVKSASPDNLTIEEGLVETIVKAGFDIEDFGNGTVIVRSCPIDLDNQEIAPLIDEIAQYLIKNRRDITNEHLDWIYHNVACRSAIKAGDESSEIELLALAKQVVNDPQVRFCPNGRPVMIELTKYELEKQFGRV